MEVKDANSALLSNYEVFQLLTDLKEQRKESGKNKHSSGQQNLNTITYETRLKLRLLGKNATEEMCPSHCMVQDIKIYIKNTMQAPES